jgi:hypothetical protein
VVATFSAILAEVGIIIGGWFWTACPGAIMRWRDWHTVTCQTDGVTIMAPVLIRVRCPLEILMPAR